MPSSQTITSFYSFVANTKARATQMNNNFDVIRGHFIPIHVSTQTSANMTYDLGSTEYRWRTSYHGSIDLQSNTTTGKALQIVGETSGSSAAISFKIAGVERFRIRESVDVTTSAAAGQYALSAGATITSTAVTTGVLGLTVTIQSLGSPIEIGFVNFTTVPSFYVNPLSTTGTMSLRFSILKGSSVLITKELIAPGNDTFAHPLEALGQIDFAAAGTHTYSVRLEPSAAMNMVLGGYKMYAKEKV